VSFKATFSPPFAFTAEFESAPEMVTEFGAHIVVPITDYFTGEYVYTPTSEEQTIPIIGKTARQNITINPIPSNYGLISWNGATLTVS